jgi:hypothetical protein
MACLKASVVVDNVSHEVATDAQMHALVTAANVSCQILDLCHTRIALECDVRIWVLIQLLSSWSFPCL